MKRRWQLSLWSRIALVGVFVLSTTACEEVSPLPLGTTATPTDQPSTPASAILKRTVSPADVSPPATASSPGPVVTLPPLTSGLAGTGIEGLVMIGPTCAVVTLASPCPDRTYAATVSVRDGSGREVNRFQTGGDGRFRVELSPGVYTLVPINPRPGVPPRGREQTVAVVDGRITPVLVTYDSGIR